MVASGMRLASSRPPSLRQRVHPLHPGRSADRDGNLLRCESPRSTHCEVLVDSSSWISRPFTEKNREPLAALSNHFGLVYWQILHGLAQEHIRGAFATGAS